MERHTNFALGYIWLRFCLLKTWIDHGLSSYCTYFCNGKLKDFQALIRQNQLQNNDFFRFLQVRHHIQVFLPKNRLIFETPILRIFVKAYIADSGQKIISRLYKDLQEIKNTNSNYIKQQWEGESRGMIQEDVWFKQCTFQWKMTCSNSWRSFGWKSLCRFFITPAQSSHYSGSSSCWRNCGTHGAKHLHLFWACPAIVLFWNQFQIEVKTIFNWQTSLHWDELLFGLLYSVNKDIETKKLFGMLSLAARKCITKKWLNSVPPNIDDWHKVVYSIFVMERITFCKRLQMDKFNKIWDRWKIYIMLRHPEYVWFPVYHVKNVNAFAW